MYKYIYICTYSSVQYLHIYKYKYMYLIKGIVSPKNPTFLGDDLICQDLSQLQKPRPRQSRSARQRPKQPLRILLGCRKWLRKPWKRWRLRSAMVSVIVHCNYWHQSQHNVGPTTQQLQILQYAMIFWGGLLKKELSNVTSVFLELPQSNQLRITLGAYKSRFEEYMDEHLGWI